ncbi:MAG: ribonuclease Z [Desulfomonile sp.]|nr:ribonuclease Z [Desulfomonile sp.]
MKITILGSGTCTPSLERNAAGVAIEAAGLLVLVDIGPGTIRRMCEAGIDPRSIDVIAITHFHVDHVSDLAAFLFASNYAYKSMREEPFHFVGPEGLEQFYKGLVAVYQDWIVPRGGRLRIRELKAQARDEFVLDGLRIVSGPALHYFPSLSYRIEAESAVVTITGDTDFSADVAELARGSDLFISECSMPEGRKVPGHMVPSEAGRTAALARAKKLVLTHFYPPCEEVDVAGQAGAFFSGEILKAVDLMTLEV